MEVVKEYFLCVMSAAVAAGIIGMLAPEGSGVGKYVKFAVSLCVLLSVLAPLRPAIEYLYALSETDAEMMIDESIEKYTDSTNKLIIEQNVNVVINTIKQKLLEKFDIPAHECEVSVDTKEESGEVSVSKITVVLSGYSMWKDPKEISSFVSELCGCECEVILG